MKKLFLSVGAMKAGTTWLYGILKHHPSLYFTPEKEIHFLYDYYTNNNVLSDENRLRNAKNKLSNFEGKNIGVYRMLSRWYAMYLENKSTLAWYDRVFSLNKKRPYNCDFSNLTCHIESEHWRDLNTKYAIKAIYILRDPVERLWSHIKFHFQYSGKSLDFENWTSKQFEDLIKKPFLWDNVIYPERIKSLQNGLPDSKFKIIFFEDMVTKPKQSLDFFTDFLDIEKVDVPEEILSKKVNVTKKITRPGAFDEAAKKLLKPIYSELAEMGFESEHWAKF